MIGVVGPLRAMAAGLDEAGLDPQVQSPIV